MSEEKLSLSEIAILLAQGTDMSYMIRSLKLYKSWWEEKAKEATWELAPLWMDLSANGADAIFRLQTCVNIIERYGVPVPPPRPWREKIQKRLLLRP